jgi:LacI family transcriptional regulator
VQFGHRRIAYIHAPLELNFAMQRHQGYLQGLQQAGLAPTAEWIVPANFALGRRGGYQAMQQLLNVAQRPTAVVVDNSLACIGALRALMDAGLQPGRDLSVIAQDFVSEADLLVMPSITSIEHADAHRVGAQLAELVQGVQQKRPLSSLQVLWQPTLRPGASDGPAP